jgi:Ring finger domain
MLPPRSRGRSVRFAALPDLPHNTQEEAAVEEEKTVDEEQAQLGESCAHENEEETTRLEGSSRNMELSSERRTQSTCSCLSWIPSFSSTPSDSLSMTQEPRRRRKYNIIARAISRSFDDSETFCGICLMDYQVGEKVCSSLNEECVHVFHKDCMLDWLIRKRRCPICRRDYVS